MFSYRFPKRLDQFTLPSVARLSLSFCVFLSWSLSLCTSLSLHPPVFVLSFPLILHPQQTLTPVCQTGMHSSHPNFLLPDRTLPPSMAPLALVGFALLLGAPPCSGAATPTPSLPPLPTNDSDTSTEVCQGSNRCQPGVLLPVWEPDDPSLGDKAARAVVYFVAMVYMFLGVSIIADRFMASIEVITSKEKEITITKANGETSVGTVRIWNETVSNLTLMALGSSAPEILLSVIEVCGHNFQAGELGPGTIVGSAAFNMFVVIAVCIYVIPAGESRKIKHLRVFFVTASWSIFAYVWLYLILAVFSPGVVQVSKDPWTPAWCMHVCKTQRGGSLGSESRFRYLQKCMLTPERAARYDVESRTAQEPWAGEGWLGLESSGCSPPCLDGATGPGKGSSAQSGVPFAIYPSTRDTFSLSQG